MKTQSPGAQIHDKSVRKQAIAPPRLRRLRHRVHLQPVGAVLVRGGGLSSADAIRWRRLPVPGLPAQEGSARRARGGVMTGKWNVSAVLLDMDGTLLDTEKV